MNLKKAILEAVVAFGLAGCAHTGDYVQLLGCREEGIVMLCSDYIDGQSVSYYRSLPEKTDKRFCGIRVLARDKWFSVADQACDGVADLYQEGNAGGMSPAVRREDDDAKFREVYDPMLEKFRSMLWNEKSPDYQYPRRL